ncbi:hypothetical protein BJX99DRAFT_261547 [Aspergillus californicus]
MTETHPVYLVKLNLAVQDPDATGTRYHTGIFVMTDPEGKGRMYQVTGDITSPGGMEYTPQSEPTPEQCEAIHSLDQIGVTPAATHPAEWDRVLRGIPPPPQQKAFNVKTLKTEPFKTMVPLVFYEPGEVRRPLVKCTEWTMGLALPALRETGLLIE